MKTAARHGASETSVLQLVKAAHRAATQALSKQQLARASNALRPQTVIMRLCYRGNGGHTAASVAKLKAAERQLTAEAIGGRGQTPTEARWKAEARRHIRAHEAAATRRQRNRQREQFISSSSATVKDRDCVALAG